MAKIDGAYVVPTDARAEYRALIQRANRRVQANLKYIQDNEIRDNQVKTMLVGDFSSKRTWATPKMPFSSSTKFESKKAYDQYIRQVMKWGEDTGTKGSFPAAPDNIAGEYKESILKAINGLVRNKGISLEDWKGNLPPELMDELDSLSIEQMTHFFRSVDPSGEVELFDSDQVEYEEIDDFLTYIFGIVGEVKKFYPAAAPKPKQRKKHTTKKKGKKKKKRTTKRGRKK